MKRFIKRALIALLVLIVILLIVSRVGGQSGTEVSTRHTATSTQQVARTPGINPSCFAASAKNPILSNGSLFSGANWNDPTMLLDGGQHVMYASADKNFGGNIAIYRLTSTNGSNWALSPSAPVLEKNTDTSAWDSKSVETPSVVKFNGTYYLFYIAYNTSFGDTAAYKIGVATSQDGITWQRSAQPVLAPENPKGDPDLAFDQYIIGEPGAVVFNGSIYLYFTALGANKSVGTTLQTIGMMRSSDGVHWSEPQQVLAPDQSVYARSQGWVGYSTPSATVVNGKVHLFFDVANERPSWHQSEIRHAVSSNGTSGWAVDSDPIFVRSDFGWTKDEIRAPFALLNGTNLELWFAGNSGNNLGVGVANCDTQE